MKNFDQSPQVNEEEKMGKERLQDLKIKPEGFEILDQKFPVSDEKNLDRDILQAAKDALRNNAIRVIEYDGEEYYVSPDAAKTILPIEEIERIEKLNSEK